MTSFPPPPLPDPSLMSPLAPFKGREPEAPEWFRNALAFPHQRHMVTVEGGDIEWLEWGERGRPGLIFIHGGAAHADWWRFIAPFLAAGRHVIAPGLSGMGGSCHRAAYSVDLHAREVLAVADAAGMAQPFTLIAHSYGGYVAVNIASGWPELVAQMIILDSAFPDIQPPGSGVRPPHRVYPTLEAALARFRWSPQQPTLNPYIADFIARHSLKQVPGGWSWKFDSSLWAKSDYSGRQSDLQAIRTPLVYVGGDRSLFADRFDQIAGRLPAGARLLQLPEARHHLMADQPLALVAMLRALLI